MLRMGSDAEDWTTCGMMVDWDGSWSLSSSPRCITISSTPFGTLGLFHTKLKNEVSVSVGASILGCDHRNQHDTQPMREISIANRTRNGRPPCRQSGDARIKPDTR